MTTEGALLAAGVEAVRLSSTSASPGRDGGDGVAGRTAVEQAPRGSDRPGLRGEEAGRPA